MFNVYKNHQSRKTGNRNLTGPKTLPTIRHTYISLNDDDVGSSNTLSLNDDDVCLVLTTPLV